MIYAENENYRLIKIDYINNTFSYVIQNNFHIRKHAFGSRFIIRTWTDMKKFLSLSEALKYFKGNLNNEYLKKDDIL
jgi:hypothetical protein